MGKKRRHSSDSPDGENRQSQAKEQQLRATLQQLKAANQQLRASQVEVYRIMYLGSFCKGKQNGKEMYPPVSCVDSCDIFNDHLPRHGCD